MPKAFGVEKIVLAGPPCSGKSSAGPLAADILGLPFADLDCLVEAQLGAAVESVFLSAGETAFRDAEAGCLESALDPACGGLVLAVGGGALLRPASLALAVSRATLVTLWARDDILVERSLGGRRPLAPDGRAMEELLRSRANHYMLLPNRIDTSFLTPSDTADAIASTVRAIHGVRG